MALFDRFQSQYKYVYEYIKSGKPGQPKAVFANRLSQPYWSSNDMIVNLMIHDIDYLYWMLGKPNSVISLGTQTPAGANEHINILLEYENTSVMLEGSTVMPKSFPFSTCIRIVCENEAIELKWYWGPNGPVNDLTLYPNDGEPEKIVIPDYDPYQAECRYMIDCINRKADPKLLGIETAYNINLYLKNTTLSETSAEIQYTFEIPPSRLTPDKRGLTALNRLLVFHRLSSVLAHYVSSSSPA